MSWHFYKHETGWAIWSTVVDDWIIAGLSEEELVDYYAGEKEQRARHKAENYIQTIEKGKDPYYGYGPTEEEAARLTEICDGDGE